MEDDNLRPIDIRPEIWEILKEMRAKKKNRPERLREKILQVKKQWGFLDPEDKIPQ